MTETIEIRMDGAPVAKGRHRHRLSTKTNIFGNKVPFIRTHPDVKTENFETQLGWAARAVMKDRPLLTGPLLMTTFSFLPIPQSWSAKKRAAAIRGEIYPTIRPDYDNLSKAISDALNKVVWQDDAQVVTATIHKRYSERPRTEISISPLISA